MSAESSSDGSQTLSLTPVEKRVYGQLFRQADTDNVGVVTGEIAVSFFEKTRLDTRLLGKIWQISDVENRGFLTPAGFSVALRLIGHAQAGREPTAELARQSGPIPRFDGVALASATSPPHPPAVQPQGTGSGPRVPPPAVLPQATGAGPVRVPPLPAEKIAQYTSIFERQNLVAGNLLPGEQAKQIFEKSGLPNESLGLVWQLADIEQRGAFVLPEFIIAMHLLNALKTGAMKSVPAVLPPALLEAARRGTAAPRQSPATTGPVPGIPRQFSGLAQARTGSPLNRPGITPQGTGLGSADWVITPAEKAMFDARYDELDKAKRGYITGEEAVPFLSQSNLNGDVLAQIWDLADVNSDGHLNREEFAVAMYLIRQQRARRDGTNILPATIPANLIPPSMRAQVRPAAAASAFDAPVQQPQPPAPKSALDDLFGLDAPAAPFQAPLPTGGSNASDPFGSGSVGINPGSPARSPTTTTQFKPFVPSSSFGRGLAQHHTGDKAAGPKSPAIAEDLLGDNDPEISSKLTNETAELANISNQIGSLTNQMQNLQTQRTTAQNDLTQASSQKKNFEQRLSQLRTMYEKEVKDVRGLEEQLSNARSETRKLQAECMSLEGTYQDLQNQRQQVLAGLEADQQENANLKEKIRALNTEIGQLKPQIEKMKSEARQQKGLVAINKKQLSTNEGERDKLKTEIDELSKESEELSRQLTGGSLQSGPAPVASPAPSSGSGNNPFFKRTASTDIVGTFQSPPMKSSDKLFDDIFGAPFPSATGTPPPPAAKQHHTGNSSASAGSFATPATSTPTISRQATLNAEPPAPPESRQISSSFLPLKDPAESLTSSRQVSPPMSREGDENGGPSSPVPSVGAFPSIDSSTGQGAVASPSETKPTADSANGAPVSPESAAKLAETALSPPAESTVRDSDPFSAMDQAKAKADFDNAFASFTKINKTQDKPATDNNAFSSFNTEFPPISELEREDESDDSDSDQGGFDDDFSPAPPKDTSKGSGDAKDDASTSLPPAAASHAFDTAVRPDADVADKPQQSGAIDSKPDNVDDIFGAPASSTPTAPPAAAVSQPAAAPPTAKTPFDDDSDDDFSGLEDAKEGSADDDFANISRSGLDEFNSVFDSSPPASQVKSESTAFGGADSFDFATTSTGSIGGSNPTPTAPTATGTAASGAAGPGGISASDAQDWDAMFSNLESTSTGSAKGGEAKETRPEVERADTGVSEHDDPLLKNLTSMGYPRTDALAALEKYDYDIERAANYLASQS